MENKPVVAIRLDCSLEQIRQWLFYYALPIDNEYQIFRDTLNSTDKKPRLLMLLRDKSNMDIFLGKQRILQRGFAFEDEVTEQDFKASEKYMSIGLQQAGWMENDQKIGLLEIMERNFDNPILFLYIDSKEIYPIAEIFYRNLCEDFFLNKVLPKMIDDSLLVELDINKEDDIEGNCQQGKDGKQLDEIGKSENADENGSNLSTDIASIQQIPRKPSPSIKNNKQKEPWEQIDDHNWDRKALELWWGGKNYAQIASALKPEYDIKPKTVRNRLSNLRTKYNKNEKIIVPLTTDSRRFGK